MPIYRYNGKTYNVPTEMVSEFETKRPNATEEFEVNGKFYDVPLSEREAFKKHFGIGVDSSNSADSGVADGSNGANGADVMPQYPSIQEAVDEARKKADAAKDNGYAAPWSGVGQTEVPETIARPQQMTPWDVNRAAYESDEDKRIDGEFTPKPAYVPNEVYNNYGQRFALTERGKQLGKELEDIQHKAQQELWNEWQNSDEYKQVLADYRHQAKGKSSAEVDEISKRMNEDLENRFHLQYGDRYQEAVKPYQEVYNKELAQRYGDRINAEIAQMDKAAQGDIVKDMTADVDRQLVRAKQGRESNFYGPYLSAMRGRSAMTDEERTLYAAKRQLEQSEEMIDAAKNDSGVFRGVADNLDWENWTFGVMDLEDAQALNKALKKSDAGEKLTEAEQTLLDSALTNMIVQGYYASDLGRGYKAGQVFAESLPFMLEFIANPISSAGSASAKSMLNYGMKKYGLSLAKKNMRNRAIKTGAKMVEGASKLGLDKALGMTATSSLGRVAAGTYERLNENYDIKQGEDLGAYAEKNDRNMGVGEAIARSAASTFFENQSEMIFRAFGGASELIKNAVPQSLAGGAAELVSRLGRTKIGNLYNRIHNSPWGKRMKVAKNRAAVGGIGEEYLEEVYNNFANVAIGEMSAEDALSLENNIDTFLGLVPTQVMFSAIGVGGFVRDKYRNNKAIARHMNALGEKRAQEVQEAVIASRGDETKLTKYLSGVAIDGVMGEEEKKNIFGLAKELREKDALDGIEEARATETQTQQEAATERGYSAETPQEKHQLAIQYDKMQAWKDGLKDEDGQFASLLDMEDRDAAVQAMNEQGYAQRMEEAINYWEVTDAFNGMIEGMEDRVAAEVADANKLASTRAHVNGTIVEATTADRGTVFVKSGQIVLNEDGTVNIAQSDDVLMVVTEDGKREMIAPNRITQAAERGTLQDVINANNTTLREQLLNREAEAADLNANTPQIVPNTQVNVGGVPMMVAGVEGGNAILVNQQDTKAQPIVMPVGQLRQTLSDELDSGNSANSLKEDAMNGQIPQEAPTELAHTIDDIVAADVGEIAPEHRKSYINRRIADLQTKKRIINKRKKIHENKVNVANKAAWQAEEIRITEANKAEEIRVKTLIEEIDKELAALRNLKVDNVSANEVQNESVPSGQIEQSVSGEQQNVNNGTNVAATTEATITETPAAPKTEEEIKAENKKKLATITQMEEAEARKVLYDNFGDKMKHKVAVTREAADKKLEAAVKKAEKAQQVLDDTPIGEEEKAEAALLKAQEELKEAQRVVDFWGRIDDGFKGVQETAAETPKVDAALNEPQTPEERAAEAIGNGEVKLLQDSFKRETGYGNTETREFLGIFARKEKGGKTIEEAAEYLVAQDANDQLFGGDVQNARNAILNVLSQTKKKSELKNYIANSRQAAVEADMQAEREAYEEWVQANYGMSVDEYEAYVSMLEETRPSDVVVEEIRTIFAEAYIEEENRLNNIENEQGRISESVEGSNEVLLGEQTDLQRGNESVSEGGQGNETGIRTDSENAASQEEVEAGGEVEEKPVAEREASDVLGRIEDIAKEEERRKPLRARAREWEEKLGVKVRLMEDVADVTNASARRAILAGRKVTGWYDDATGEVCLYMPYIANEKEIDLTYIHEVVAHKGLRQMLGEAGFNDLCDRVYEMMSPEDRHKMLGYSGVANIADETERKRAAADEYMAHLAEDTELNPSVWNEIVEFVKRILWKLIGKKYNKVDVAELIRECYINLSENKGQEGGNFGGETRFNAKKKKSLETVSDSQVNRHQTVISSDNGAKVLNNLDNLAKEYENNAQTKEKTFIGEVARALNMPDRGKSSQYGTFEAKNGKVFTIRLSNHNATVSNFDNAGEEDGISIVVASAPNGGINNDGEAHIVEYYYNSIALRKAEGKPLAEIVKSIKQALYSGEYEDTTGLAQRQEVNGTRFREVFHGSAADFDKFDHSHMGEGEGNQSYGWGTYVTEVEGVGRRYANAAQRSFVNWDVMQYEDRVRDDERYISFIKHELEELRSITKFNNPSHKARVLHQIDKYEKKLAESESDLAKDKAELDKWSKIADENGGRHLYKVEIPDNDGSNYLSYKADNSQEVIDRVNAAYRNMLLERGVEEEDIAPDFAPFGKGVSGESIYALFSRELGSDKAASEFLNRHGFAGIVYPVNEKAGGNKEGASNYVIFNENDLEINGHTRFRSVESEEIVKVPQSEVWYTADNIGEKLYRMSGQYMHRLYGVEGYWERGRVLKKGTAEIDQEKAKQEYKEMKPAFDDYRKELIEMKGHSTEAAQEVINELIADIDYSIQYYKDLSEGKDVWRTGNMPRFRFVDEMTNDEIYDGLNELSEYSNGAYNLMNALEEYYGGRIVSASNGARRAIKDGLVPVPKGQYEGLNEEYHHFEFEDENGETFVKAVPFVEAEGVEKNEGIRFREPEEVNAKFNEELQQQIDGTLPKGHVYQLGMPSEVLRSAGIEALPIELASSRLVDKSMQDNHPFELSEVENLPEAIHNPLAVFVSATKVGSNVILTELKHGGKNFVAVLRVRPNKKRIEVNQIRSLYPKNAHGIIDWINNDLATYVDKGRMTEWIEKQNELLSKPQSNSVEVRKQLVSAAKIVEEFENPKLSGEKTRFREVFHGSAADFDKFDHSKMGSGAGSQVFGWGTYVTDSEDIAKEYGDVALKGENKFSYVGDKEVGKWILADAEQLMDRNGSYEAVEKKYFHVPLAPNTALAQAVEFIKSTKKEDWQGNRYLYKINIPDVKRGNYIVYGNNVTDAAAKKVFDGIYERLSNTEEYDNTMAKKVLKEELDSLRDGYGQGKSGIWKDLYGDIASYLGTEKDASMFLRSLGYVGIKYPSGTIFGGKYKGSENYVIFDEKDLEINDKTRFRVREEEMERAIAEYRKEYKSAPFSVFYTRDGALQELMSLGASRKLINKILSVMKDVNNWGVFSEELNRIFIFAENIPNEKNVKYAFKHENAHASMNKLFPEGKRDAEFDELYEVFKNDISNRYVSEILDKYKDESERVRKEEVIAFGIEIFNENDILNKLQGNARELYTEILTDNKKEYVVQSNRRNHSDSEQEGGIDTRRKEDNERLHSGTSQRRDRSNLETPKGAELQVKEGVILDEVVRLEKELNTAVNVIDEFDALPEGKAKEAIKAGRKILGWYQDGKVYIYMPNARGAEDVRATVYHEVVGHLGLRELLGERFGEFLNGVYMNVPQEVRDEINRRAGKNGWNFHEATEEYMAELAERYARGEQVKGWKKLLYTIRDAVVKALNRLGMNVGFKMSDNYLMYVLWRSRQRLAPSDVMGRITDRYMRNVFNVDGDVVVPVTKKNSGYSDNSDYRGVRFREVEDNTRAAYAKGVNTGSKGEAAMTWYNLMEAFQDEMRSLKIAQDILEKKAGRKLASYEDAYMAENRLSSVNIQEYKRFVDNEYEDMMKFTDKWISSKEETEKSIHAYLFAKTGLERNREMTVRDSLRKQVEEQMISQEEAEFTLNNYNAERNELRRLLREGKIDYKEFNERMDTVAKGYAGVKEIADYSGLTTLTDSEEDFTKEAQDIVAKFEERHSKIGKNNKPEYEEFWDAIRACTYGTLKKSYDSGLISKKVLDHVSQMFEWYIPLRGFDEKVAEDVYDYINNDNGVSSFSPTLKKAKGRKSLPDDPLATIANMMQSAILQGNRNLMKQKFLNMVTNIPSELFTVKNVWLVKKEYMNEDGTTTEEWEESYPNITEGMTPEEIENTLNAHDAEMRALQKDKKAMKKREGLNLNYKVVNRNNSNQHMVTVKRGGVDFVIYVNGNPRVAQALNGMLKDTTDNKLMQWWNKYARYYSASRTSYNIDFVGTNMVRDMQHSTMMTFIQDGGKDAAMLVLNGFKTIIPLIKGVSGKSDDSKYGKYFEEFLANGGETGYSHLNSVDDWKKMNNDRIGRLKSFKKVLRHAKNAINPLGYAKDAFEYINRLAEDATRFNIYLLNREKGVDIATSIKRAKDITVNFNKKGSGKTNGIFGSIANVLRATFPFFNPIIQGIYQFIKVGREHKAKMAAVLGANFALGVVVPFINEYLAGLFGDDDDDYMNQSDYARRNNLMIFTGDGYIKIPLAPMFREVYALGDVLYCAIRGYLKSGEAAGETINLIRNMFSLGGQSSLKDAPFSPVRTIVPSQLGFLVDVMENTNYAGAPIYKESWNEYTPEHQKVYKGTWTLAIDASAAINRMMGGEENLAAENSSLWLNPAVWQHVITEVVGAPARTIGNVGELILVDEDNFTWSSVPVLGRFYTEPTDRTVNAATNRRFFDIADKYERIDYIVGQYEKKINAGDGVAFSRFEDYQKSEDYKWYISIQEDMDNIDKLVRSKKKADDVEAVEKEIIDTRKKVVNKVYKKVDE